MTMIYWGRALLIGGIAAALLSVLPLLLTGLLPVLDEGIPGLIAIMLTFTVTPLAVIVASAGAILLLVGVIRRDRF
jgi:hypothetical protein